MAEPSADAAYRVFSQFSEHADSWPGDRAPFLDNWHSSMSGARVDWSRGANAFLAQGHFATNRTRAGWLALPSLTPGAAPMTDGVSHANEASVLGRWTRTWTSGTHPPGAGVPHHDCAGTSRSSEFTESSSDLDAQYETRVGSRHGLMFGGGYRHVDVSVDNTVTAQMASNRIETFNTFLQDEISVRPGCGPDARFEARVRHVRRLGRAAVGTRHLGGIRRASACGPPPRARAARHRTPIALSSSILV